MTSSSSSYRNLRLAAATATALISIQLVLGVAGLAGSNGLLEPHGWIGYVTTLTTATAAYFAWQVSRQTHSKGVFFHAVSLPVLCVLQIGLAEMDLKWVHVALGVTLVVAVAGLFAMTRRGAPEESGSAA